MRLETLKTIAAAAGLAAGVISATPALAVTFAQTQQANPAQSTFFFTNNGNGTSTISGSGQLGLLLTDDPPLEAPLFMGIFDFQPVDFSYTGTSTQSAFLAGPTYQQLIDSGTLTFTNALGNILTVTFTNALLGGRDGGVFLWGGDDTSIGASVSYTSDFDSPELSTFDGSDNFMLALTLNPSSSNLALGSNGQLASFQASATGTFRTAVPEPGAWAMMILGFGGVGGLMRRRRERLAFA